MEVQQQIEEYINSQPEQKRRDRLELHRRMLDIAKDTKLWFHDGRDDKGKVVSNPNIGYGLYTIKYADGKTRDFYRVGLSANKTGISVYILGLDDKKYLADTYGEKLGKAKVTGYCISFKALKDIDPDVLEDAVKDRMSSPD